VLVLVDVDGLVDVEVLVDVDDVVVVQDEKGTFDGRYV
jgi:hypothetical protein